MNKTRFRSAVERVISNLKSGKPGSSKTNVCATGTLSVESYTNITNVSSTGTISVESYTNITTCNQT